MVAKLIRSLLFVPGNRPNMLDKALGVRPDVYVPDLEDSVPDGEKDNARAVVHDHLPKLQHSGRLVIPRVNALETGRAEDDLAALVGPQIHGVSIGKVRSVDDIRTIDNIITKLEIAAGLRSGSVYLVPWIETALAIVHCYEILNASGRIIGAGFGAEDLTHDMDIERSDDPVQLAYARSAFCFAARAAEVLALDTPYFQFKNEAGLKQDALNARLLGFKGKFAIHPAQIDTINTCFSPSAAEIEHAKRVVAAFEEAERNGRGSTALDGKVIDVPVVKRARAVLALAAQSH